MSCDIVNQGVEERRKTAENMVVLRLWRRRSRALPDDPNELKAMLLAERARNERLVQIIKEMQRHRFGRRAETLPEDQMLLALEEVEQTEAGAAAAAEAKSAAERAEGGQKAPHESRCAACPSAAHRDHRRHRREGLSLLQGRASPDRRGCLRTARYRAGAVPGAGDAASQIRLPRLRGRRRAGAGPGAADPRRPADGSNSRPCARLQIRRPPSALSSGADLREARDRPRSINARRLGWPRRLAFAPRA